MSRPSCRSVFFLSLLLAAVGFATSATAAITAGSLAIIGYDDSIDQFGGTDYVSIATLAPISAGEVVYLTDNGWFGSSFRGAADAFGGGTGVESISRLTFNVAIPAGTILSTFDSSTDYTWDFSSAIGLSGGGAALGNYSPPTLNSSPLADGSLTDAADTLYLFQSLNSNNPLFNPSTFVYAMHKGTAFDTSFSGTVSDQTGEVPPGLSESNDTAVVHYKPGAPSFFNDQAYTLNKNAAPVAALLSTGGTAAQWLAAIADATNWEIATYTSDTTLPSNSPTLLTVVIPEPSRSALLLPPLLGLILRRRR